MANVETVSSPVACRPRVDYMKRYITWCKLLSLWPRECANPIRYWLVFIMVLTSGGAVVSAMYFHIYRQVGNIDSVAQVFDFATVYTSSLFRFLHVFANGTRYRRMVDVMHETFVHESFNRRGDKLTMDKYVRTGKIISYSYSILIQVWLLHMSATPLAQYFIIKSIRNENGTFAYPDAQLKMSLEIEMPFDTSEPHVAYVSHAFVVVSYYAMALVYSFMDSFWFAVIILTTGQFELISHSIRSLSAGETDEEEEEEEEESRDDDEDELVISSCLNQHIRVREFANIIEELMSPSVLVDFLHAVSSISFILLDMTLAIYQDSAIKILNLLGYLMVSISHMWVLDYFGNELTVKEQEISAAIYESPWYKHPKKSKSSTLLMMILAQNPCKLTGGKLYRVSLEFFAGTMRTVFSYFTVLLQLRESTERSEKETLSVT